MLVMGAKRTKTYAEHHEFVRVAMTRTEAEYEAEEFNAPSAIAEQSTRDILLTAESMGLPSPDDVDVDAMGGFAIEWGEERPFFLLEITNNGSVIYLPYMRDDDTVKATRVTGNIVDTLREIALKANGGR